MTEPSTRPAPGAEAGELVANLSSGTDVFAGGGEMGVLMRATDWSATPLGPVETWPQSLFTVVRILLTSRYAMWVGWGPDLTFLYNDAYGAMSLGEKHPRALGKPAREVWPEIWKEIGPRIEAVLETETATWDEALLLFLERHGYAEESYHTFSYSPLPGDDGAVAGMLCVVTEETERVIQERRLALLHGLASALSATITEADVVAAIEQSLGANTSDLPFTLTYLFEDEGRLARLACATGIAPGHAAAPDVIGAGAGGADDTSGNVWPFDGISSSGGTVMVNGLASHFHDLPTGAWQTPPQHAVVVPLSQQGQERPAGFLVVALNPYRPFRTDYAGFIDLVAGQIAASVANARAYEGEKRRAEALAELDRAKTTFFSNVSHEFRTPLTLMLAPAEDALADMDTTPANRERLEVIQRNAVRMLKLVNTMLDFSSIEAGRTQTAFEPTNLAAFTSELASGFRSAIERAGLGLVVEAQPLGEPVYLDRDMWEKIVLNLLSNAFKHTFEGEIGVRVFARDGRAVMEVRDTGVGIPPEQADRVFERFHRVPNARSRTHEGTGIGLALVQELVKIHGGSIAVESQAGAGTAFTVTLPFGRRHLADANVRPAGGQREQPRVTGSAAYMAEALSWLPGPLSDAESGDGSRYQPPLHGTRCRIVVADDNADMREYVTRLLTDRGWQVDAVADGRAALERAREVVPDLVLSDVMMPGLDGFELVHALGAQPATRDIPVILLSARAGEAARIEGVSAGAADYLVKPFSARELVARVDVQLQRARSRAAERDERRRLREMFAQAPAAIAVLRGPDHVFESVNAAYREVVGNRNVMGKTVREALPELVRQGFVDVLDGVYNTGEPFTGRGMPVVLDVPGRDAPREHFFTFVLQPMRDADQTVSGIFVVAVDVSDEVTARRDAEAANDAKSSFLAAMSHELRTPLNAIAGHVQLLEMGIHGPVTEAQREALNRVQRSEQYLLSIINDVLNFAKLEAGRVEYRLEDMPMAGIVAEVVSLVEPQVNAKALAIDVDLAPDVLVRADREKLQQILLNLLGNAIKFTASGGRIAIDMPVRSNAPAGDAAGTVFLRVSDTGIGISREKQDLVFDPFVQVHRKLTRTTEGTGLGLAISRDLARGMGGDLRVRSVEGEGSAFTLALPRGSVGVSQCAREDEKVPR